ncbi:hypothetical protein EF913_04230 [Streptomyces sp. WAC04189]|uniref:Imm50 family immunity protein n=2 Tax=Streptomyces TaxID=1883 RepID=UPI000FC19ABF|nr:hypothetical protein EF913_04230 [Streptomyces sp. WAC04189]
MARYRDARSTTTMTYSRYLMNPEKISALFGEIPEVTETRLRSINLNWRGPTVTLRVDLPGFPQRAPQEWIDAGMDTVQCHFQFLAVHNLSLRRWDPPTDARFETERLTVRQGMHVSAVGTGVDLSFDSSDSVLVGHLSSFRSHPDGSDDGPHMFVSRVDSRRHTSLPQTDEKTFYERL